MSSGRGSAASDRLRQGLAMDQLSVPGTTPAAGGTSWRRRHSDAVQQALGEDLMDQITVPQARWARRPSAVEVIDDGLSGQLVVPIYEEEDGAAGSDGLPVVPRSSEDKPAVTIQGVPVINVSINTDTASNVGMYLHTYSRPGGVTSRDKLCAVPCHSRMVGEATPIGLFRGL